MTKEEHKDVKASFDSTDLEELVTRVKRVLDVRDRKHGFPPKTYMKCFVGNEAVKKLLDEDIAGDEEDAVRIGNMMLNAGVFHHVQDAHPFENKYLFYRFTSDEDHGTVARKPDDSAVSWADFVTPVAPAEAQTLTLQPTIPERDPDLASFPQVVLEACGISPLDEYNARLLDSVHPKGWVDPTPKSSYNLVVIGAGAGGLVSAAGAAGVGARVALIESHLLGGDCLNVGCVPSKALLRCAKAAAAVRNAPAFGVNIDGNVTVDFGFVMERMRRLRASIAPIDSARRYSEQLGVDVFIGKGTFTGKNKIEVNGKTLTFAKAVIATGGTAAIPNIPGLQEAPYLTNATIFNLTELPSRLGVIGAGPIGLELAQAFQRFGSQVTVFSRSDKILPKEDPDAAKIIEKSLRQDGVTFAFHANYKRVESRIGKPQVTIVLEDGSGERLIKFDALLVATGRKPAVRGLGLESAGVSYDERMGVTINDKAQTTNPDVYAVGDVASKYQFTHTADFMARLVIRNALFFGRDKFSSLLIPWATYTDPEVAHVGLYENDLQERNIEYATFTREFSDIDRSIVDGETEGYVKIHVKKGTDRILGATIVGSHAGDMISEITVAMQSGMGLGKLANVIHPYPTAADAIRQCGDAYNRARLTPTVKGIFHRLMAFKR
ncbi:MAG: FAD-containing oxidoreductase [Deltaproteobacteria bacterium]|nr:FAD-containing oxidoreductase [Deltaproteobacteria bacterium]MBW2670560.1 FAD-containing oxidoreductase [Deltaproteobacteria bacterium]MBW2710993.1 FAD-containing oxidoreductase [Deltaproteobacteria bacterium]